MATPVIPPPDSPFATLDPRSALAMLNIAIAKAELNQRYKIGDRELHRGDLRWMYPERARLEAKISASERSGGPRFRRVIPL